MFNLDLGFLFSYKHIPNLFLSFRFVILLACLLGIEWAIALSSVFVHILVGILLVLSIQEEKQILLKPGAGIASMHMGNKPFEIPDYRTLPMLQVPAAKEIFPTDSFQVRKLPSSFILKKNKKKL